MPGICTLAVLLSATLFPPEKKPASPARWEKSVLAIEKRDKTTPPPAGAIFFCGSSSTVRWDLKKYFPDLPVFNRGFGGSQIADSVHFADRIITPQKPATVVLYAGDNDIASGKKPEKVHADFVAFVKAVHGKLPKTRILFIAIKPSVSRWKRWDDIRKANALIAAECAKDQRLTYIDIAAPMLGSDGKPKPELFVKDGLHLSPAGYELWTGIVSKHLKSSEK